MGTQSQNPLRSFLMAQPRPARVRLALGNGESRTIDVNPATKWARLAETIEALEPMNLELLDAAGTLLRAQTLAAIAEGPEAEDEPIEDASLPHDGDTSLETFARLLADAHRSSGDRAFQFVETAFSKMVDIVNAQTRRMDSMERVVDGMHKVWRRSFEQQLEEGAGEGSEQTSTLQQMLGAFMTAQAQGAMRSAVSPPTPPPAANGHANGAPPAKGR